MYCKYNQNEIADRECSYCHDGLCSAGSCGYIVGSKRLCNECYLQFEGEKEYVIGMDYGPDEKVGILFEKQKDGGLVAIAQDNSDICWHRRVINVKK